MLEASPGRPIVATPGPLIVSVAAIVSSARTTRIEPGLDVPGANTKLFAAKTRYGAMVSPLVIVPPAQVIKTDSTTTGDSLVPNPLRSSVPPLMIMLVELLATASRSPSCSVPSVTIVAPK